MYPNSSSSATGVEEKRAIVRNNCSVLKEEPGFSESTKVKGNITEEAEDTGEFADKRS